MMLVYVGVKAIRGSKCYWIKKQIDLIAFTPTRFTI